VHRSLLVPLRAALCALGALAGAEGATAFGAEVDDESADHAPEERWDARVAVTAELPESKSAPLGAASTVLDPTADNVTPSNLTDLVVDAPAVSQNGQGGHFQVFSIRGVSRHRVTNLISGMRVGSE